MNSPVTYSTHAFWWQAFPWKETVDPEQQTSTAAVQEGGLYSLAQIGSPLVRNRLDKGFPDASLMCLDDLNFWTEPGKRKENFSKL